MTFVSAIRRACGLTQAELAERAGTSRTRLSAYEHGRTEPGLAVLMRLAAAADLELHVVPAGTRTIAEQVAGIAQSVRDGDEAFALRLVAETVDHVRRGEIDFRAFVHDPGSIGERRWDALLGGCVALLAHEFGAAVPAWAAAPGRSLDEPWFISTRRSLWPSILVETPPCLAARNVFVTAASLESL